MKYIFKNKNHAGSFSVENIEGLRDKIQEIKSRPGISCGVSDIYEIKSEEDFNEINFSGEEYDGPGWYLAFFDGHFEKFETEKEALIEYIEERTETQLV